MITPEQRRHIAAQAYVPEHLPGYVTAVSPGEPFLLDDYVVYVNGERLVFVGYPLAGDFDQVQLSEILSGAIDRFKPGLVSVIGPAAPPSPPDWVVESPADAYYRLDISTLAAPQKVRHMLNRAGRDLSIHPVERCGREHKKLIKAFLRNRHLDGATQSIFKKIPECAHSPTARIFEARTGRGKLVAFDVAEFGAKDYAFYMFNIRSEQDYVPGASDLLLAQVIDEAGRAGKRYLNLGLGINPGVTFFKTKWGGVPFLRHVACLHKRSQAKMWEDIFDGLL